MSQSNSTARSFAFFGFLFLKNNNNSASTLYILRSILIFVLRFTKIQTKGTRTDFKKKSEVFPTDVSNSFYFFGKGFHGPLFKSDNFLINFYGFNDARSPKLYVSQNLTLKLSLNLTLRIRKEWTIPNGVLIWR